MKENIGQKILEKIKNSKFLSMFRRSKVKELPPAEQSPTINEEENVKNNGIRINEYGEIVRDGNIENPDVLNSDIPIFQPPTEGNEEKKTWELTDEQKQNANKDLKKENANKNLKSVEKEIDNQDDLSI